MASEQPPGYRLRIVISCAVNGEVFEDRVIVHPANTAERAAAQVLDHIELRFPVEEET